MIPKPKFGQINLVKLIDKYFDFGYRNHVYYSDSIDYYIYRRKPLLRRRLIYHSITGHLFISFLVYCVVATHPDRYAILNLGMPYFGISMKRQQEQIVNALYSFFCLIIFLARITISHLEARFKLFGHDFLYSLRFGRQLFKLNKRDQTRFNFLFYLFFQVFIRTTILFTSYSVFAVNSMICLYAYLTSEHTLNPIMLVVNLAMFILFIKTMLYTALTAITMIVMTIIFICYKFDELRLSLVIAIHRHDIKQILIHIRNHSRLTRLCKSLSNLNNIALGLVYMLLPYMSVLSIECLKYETDGYFDLLAKILFLFSFTLVNLCAYLINQSAASISVRSKVFPKLCYKVFQKSNNRSYSLRFKLKVEEFIARLNKEFIGYRCFNLFKFTKLAFFKYVLSIGVTYVLVVGFIRDM